MVFMGLWLPIPNPMMAAELPVGRTKAIIQAVAATTRTTLRTLYPPAMAVEAAIGISTDMVPMLFIKLVMTVATRQNTITTISPLGLLPRIFNTPWPMSLSTPVAERALDMVCIPITINIISELKVAVTCFTGRTLKRIITRTPAAGMMLEILLPTTSWNMKPTVTAMNTAQITASPTGLKGGSSFF